MLLLGFIGLLTVLPPKLVDFQFVKMLSTRLGSANCTKYFGSSDFDLYRLMISMRTGLLTVAAIAARTLSWLTCEKSLCSLWIMTHLLGSKTGSVGLH